jgi:ribonucleoside-diphosphate reductase alpha chain
VVTADEVTVEEHIAMQAAVQRHVDSSVSKTINAPNDHTVEDVEKAYTLAYQQGLKGVAYFRDGCGRAQVLYKEEPKQEDGPDDEDIATLIPFAIDFARPSVLHGATHKVGTKAGTAYVTVNRDDDGTAREVFFNVGKAGSDVGSLVEALGRLASLALRKGATLGGVANQLHGVGGESQFNMAIPHALATAIESDLWDAARKGVVLQSIPEEQTVEFTVPMAEFKSQHDLCPECLNLTLVRQEGCRKCVACAYSAC